MSERCTTCNGTGDIEVLTRVAGATELDDHCEFRKIQCFDCDGVGSLPEDVAERREAGGALRNIRKRRDHSLREAARLARINVVEFSRAERGKEPVHFINEVARSYVRNEAQEVFPI